MKTKIHSAVRSLDEEFGQENQFDNPTYQLQNEVQENQKAIQKVTEGLAQCHNQINHHQQQTRRFYSEHKERNVGFIIQTIMK